MINYLIGMAINKSVNENVRNSVVTELLLNLFSLCVPSVAEEMGCQNNFVPIQFASSVKNSNPSFISTIFSAIRKKTQKTAEENFVIA